MNNPQVICQPGASHTLFRTRHFIQTRALSSPRTASETTLPPNTRHCNRNHALPGTRRSVCGLNLSRTRSPTRDHVPRPRQGSVLPPRPPR